MDFAAYVLESHDRLIAAHSRFSFYQGWPRDALCLMALSVGAWLAFSVGLCRVWVGDAVWAVWPALHAGLIWSRMTVHLTQKQWLVFATLGFWGGRLLLRVLWARRGVDWKFEDLVRVVGPRLATVAALPVLFMGKSFFLFSGCLSLYTLVANDFFLVSPLFVLGLALQLGGVVLETAADEALDQAAVSPRAVLNKGLWGWTRHPNYLGECLFWVGLWISTGCELGPSLAGPVLMLFHFYFISVPKVEDHMLDTPRAAAYAEYKWLVPSSVLPLGRWHVRGSVPPQDKAPGKEEGEDDDDDEADSGSDAAPPTASSKNAKNAKNAKNKANANAATKKDSTSKKRR